MNQDLDMNTQKNRPMMFDSIGKKNVVCVSAGAPVSEAIDLMKDNQIGDVIVCEGSSKKPIGMLTDRDIALKVSKDVSFNEMKVSDVMPEGKIVTCGQNEDVFEMIRVMKEHGVSRLPIVDASGAVVRIVTAKNLLQYLTQSLVDLAEVSRNQQQKEQQTH
jgi:CBS domain-containing protein